MSDSDKETIEHIRQQIVANILAGPMPPQEEMPLLSQEYQAVWRTKDEDRGGETWMALLDAPGKQGPRPTTPEEYAFDQRTQELQRQKRRAESEQLAALARIEELLAGDRQLEDEVARHNQRLTQQIEVFRAKAEEATNAAQAEAARRRLHECQKVWKAHLKRRAELERTREKVLSATRRNAIAYLDMVKRLEARKDYQELLQKREKAASGGLGLFGTLGMILFINDFQKMAHGIDKLAKKK